MVEFTNSEFDSLPKDFPLYSLRLMGEYRPSDASYPSASNRFHQDLLSTQARRVTSSSNSPLELPTVNSFGDLPFGTWDIAIRGFAVHANMIHLQLQPLNPGSQQSTLSRIGDFPIGKSAMVMLWFTYTAKRRTSNSDDTCTPPDLMVPLCHVTPPLVRSGIAESQFQLSGSFVFENPEYRNPDSPDSCHLSLSRSTAPINWGNRDSRFCKV